jgi:hypothetical protein
MWAVASFTFEERLRHYYRQLEYWYSVLTHLRADCDILSDYAPCKL